MIKGLLRPGPFGPGPNSPKLNKMLYHNLFYVFL